MTKIKRIGIRNGGSAIIDAEDFSEVSKYKWYKSKGGYIYRVEYHGIVNGKRKFTSILLHRQVFGAKKNDKEIDHINGKKTDNRKSNLRYCTRAQNNWNRHKLPIHNKSGHVGVSKVVWRKLKKPWRAFISVNNKQVFLGWHRTKKEAINKYRWAARKYYGKYTNE